MMLGKYTRNKPPTAWLGEEPVERGLPWEEVAGSAAQTKKADDMEANKTVES